MDKYFHLSKEQQLDQIHWFLQAAKEPEIYTVTNIPDENYEEELSTYTYHKLTCSWYERDGELLKLADVNAKLDQLLEAKIEGDYFISLKMKESVALVGYQHTLCLTIDTADEYGSPHLFELEHTIAKLTGCGTQYDRVYDDQQRDETGDWSKYFEGQTSIGTQQFQKDPELPGERTVYFRHIYQHSLKQTNDEPLVLKSKKPWYHPTTFSETPILDPLTKEVLSQWALGRELLKESGQSSNIPWQDIFNCHNRAELFRLRGRVDRFNARVCLFDANILALCQKWCTPSFYERLKQLAIEHHKTKSEPFFIESRFPVSSGFLGIPKSMERRGTKRYFKDVMAHTLIYRGQKNFGVLFSKTDRKNQQAKKQVALLKDYINMRFGYGRDFKNFTFKALTSRQLRERHDSLIEQRNRAEREARRQADQRYWTTIKEQDKQEQKNYQLPSWAKPVTKLPKEYQLLKSQYSLATEGMNMSNCVASYADLVVGGMSVILHYEEKGKNRATIELCKRDKQVVIEQVFGYGNSALSKKKKDKIKSDFETIFQREVPVLLSSYGYV